MLTLARHQALNSTSKYVVPCLRLCANMEPEANNQTKSQHTARTKTVLRCVKEPRERKSQSAVGWLCQAYTGIRHGEAAAQANFLQQVLLLLRWPWPFPIFLCTSLLPYPNLCFFFPFILLYLSPSISNLCPYNLFYEVLQIEPRTSCMPGNCPTTELHPVPVSLVRGKIVQDVVVHACNLALRRL